MTQSNPQGLNTSPGDGDDGYTPPPPVVLSNGTRIQLYKDGQALFAAFEAIKSARTRVCVEVYILRNDTTGRAFVDLLCTKAAEGLAVYLIVDSFGSSESRVHYDRLRRAGVKLQEFHPIRPWESNFGWRPWSRDHRKLLFVDDDIAGVGGLNIGDEYAGPWVAINTKPTSELLRDTGMGIVGPSARPLLEAFIAVWSYCRTGGRIQKNQTVYNLRYARPAKGNRLGKQKLASLEVPSTLLADEGMLGSIGVLASAPTLSSPLRPFLYSLLTQAQARIRLVMAYFAPDDELVKHLCDAAQRGVDVRLIFAAQSDQPIMTLAARGFYQTFLDHGVHVYERQKAILHAKTLTIDGVYSLIGSTNLDYRSIEFNLELACLVRSGQFAQQVDQLMDHDMAFSLKIDPEGWRRRPTRDRFVQWLVTRARYIL
jgi:cardiolipin synthase A/B